MKFSIIYEAQMVDPSPASEARCCNEIVEQVLQAEKMGFETIWAVEHTALTQYAHMSAPETLTMRAESRGASSETPMTDVARLLAHEDIRQLAARYAVAIGRLDIDSLVELFVEDVRLPGGESGRPALRRAMITLLQGYKVAILNVGTHLIELRGADQARGVVYCDAELGDETEWIRQLIVYEDSYARRQDRWYFQSRKHSLVYGQSQQPSPLAQPPADWPTHAIGRGTAPMHWPSWRAFWKDA